MDQPIRTLTDDEVNELMMSAPDLFEFDGSSMHPEEADYWHNIHNLLFDAPGG